MKPIQADDNQYIPNVHIAKNCKIAIIKCPAQYFKYFYFKWLFEGFSLDYVQFLVLPRTSVVNMTS